jgi:hypothetical protein
MIFVDKIRMKKSKKANIIKVIYIYKVKVKQSHYGSGQALGVPGV